jgi:tetratricopeptide (TPR) repeat protein
MKRISVLLLIFCVVNGFAQNEAIERAKQLVSSKKYESAINVLNEVDPKNQDPEVVIAKTEIFLNYFVSSLMHQMFALKDLEENEDIANIRGSEGNFSMFLFMADSILTDLIISHPKNFNLYKTLGNFYHEIHLKYYESWLIPDSAVIRNFSKNYSIAYENGVYDYWSLFGLGYSYINDEDYNKAIPFFEKSIELKNDHPSSHYNLAYSYLNTGQWEKAIESATKAMNLYQIPEYKADAARLVAIAYSELENSEKAFDYYSLSNEYEPSNYYTLKSLLFYKLHFGHEAYKSTTEEFFTLAPENPIIYQDLMELYWHANKPNELIDFLRSQLNNFNDNDLVKGNIHFSMALIHYEKEEFTEAKKNFALSKDFLLNVFEPDHPAFEALDSYLNEIK